MSILKRPENVSDKAWQILQAVYKNYYYNDSKEFDDFSQFNFSKEELSKYCQELQDKRFIFFENPDTESMYLYMLATVLPYEATN